MAHIAVLLAVAGCTERPSAVDRVVEENHKASEALVEAARDAASRAGDHAQDAAHAARSALDAAVSAGGNGEN
jgi:hypothetical protein